MIWLVSHNFLKIYTLQTFRALVVIIIYFDKARCVDISPDGMAYAVGTTGGVLHVAKMETKVTGCLLFLALLVYVNFASRLG